MLMFLGNLFMMLQIRTSERLFWYIKFFINKKKVFFERVNASVVFCYRSLFNY